MFLGFLGSYLTMFVLLPVFLVYFIGLAGLLGVALRCVVAVCV